MNTISSNYLSLTDSVDALPSVWDTLLTISGEDARHQEKSEDCQTRMAREIALLIKDGYVTAENYNMMFRPAKITRKKDNVKVNYAMSEIANGRADELQTQFGDKFTVLEHFAFMKSLCVNYGKFVSDCEIDLWDMFCMSKLEGSVFLTKHQASEGRKAIEGLKNQIAVMKRIAMKLLGVSGKDTERKTDLEKATDKLKGALKNLEGEISPNIDVAKASEFVAKALNVLVTPIAKPSTK
jgi:hypothetical protein